MHNHWHNNLKQGFTTGSAATAASLACLEMILTKRAPRVVTTPLPPFTKQQMTHTLLPRAYLDIEILKCYLLETNTQNNYNLPTQAYACVKKNGGSDPDATHGAEIEVILTLDFSSTLDNAPITITGGKGVGRVTLPGLALPIGAWAINQIPQEQIKFAISSLWNKYTTSPRPTINVQISVPQGETIAKQTFNPRLGILGGISILGTHGTVIPFSHTAFKASIDQQLDVAKALGEQTIYFCTGRRSERLLQNLYRHTQITSFVQIADFIAHALQAAHKHNFTSIIMGFFFGKLVKLAQGHGYTHAHNCNIDYNLLAKLSQDMGCTCSSHIAKANTALQVLNLLMADTLGHKVIDYLKHQAQLTAELFAKQHVHIHLFHLDGFEL